MVDREIALVRVIAGEFIDKPSQSARLGTFTNAIELAVESGKVHLEFLCKIAHELFSIRLGDLHIPEEFGLQRRFEVQLFRYVGQQTFSELGTYPFAGSIDLYAILVERPQTGLEGFDGLGLMIVVSDPVVFL